MEIESKEGSTNQVTTTHFDGDVTEYVGKEIVEKMIVQWNDKISN